MLFISHSSKNNRHAERIRDWLVSNGWRKEQFYLDLTSLRTGDRWRKELNEAISTCEAVIVCLSSHWIESAECAREFGMFENAGKLILPILVEKTSKSIPSFVAELQVSDVSDESKNGAGFEQLRSALQRAGIGPGYFPWPPPDDPDRAPFRGLEALTEKDAAVFFGRDREIAAGLDTLRQMRMSIRKRLLVIAAPSGAGKSSFLNAGLLARLRRESGSFFILPSIRGNDSPIRSLAQRLALDGDSNIEQILQEFDRIADDNVQTLHDDFDNISGSHCRNSTLVLPIDQAEEMFSINGDVRDEFGELLARCFERLSEFIVIMSIRVDFLAMLQSDKRISGHIELLNLPLLRPMDFREVIEGPAAFMQPAIEIEPELTERLIDDLDGADALPLLAFTLRRMFEQAGEEHRLYLKDYAVTQGGLSGVIAAAVHAAVGKARLVLLPAIDDVELSRLIRSVFIPWLVQLDEHDASPRRRVASFKEIPNEALLLVGLLVDERLLSTSNRDGEPCVEVVHEAVLRDWRDLREWIREEAAALVLLQGVKRATVDWQKARHDGVNRKDMLVHHGERLERVKALLNRQEYARALDGGPSRYVAACQHAEEVNQLRALDQEIKLQEQTAIADAERQRAEIGWLIMLARQSRELSMSGESTLGLLLAIESASTANSSSTASAHAESALISALLNHSEHRILYAPSEVYQARFSPSGEHVITVCSDGTVTIHSVAERERILNLCGHTAAVFSACFSSTGKKVVTASADGSAILWDASSGKIIYRLEDHDGEVRGASFSQSDALVITASVDGTANLWCTRSGESVHRLQNGGLVWAAKFTIDGTKAITCSNALRSWDVHSGRTLWIAGEEVQGGVTEIALPSKADEPLVASASGQMLGHVWDSGTGQLIATLEGHADLIYRLIFSADASRLLTVSADGTARVWQAKTGNELAIHTGHGGKVYDGCFMCDDKLIVTASADGTATVSESLNGRVLNTFRGHSGALLSVDVSSQEHFAVTSSVDGTSRIWNLEDNVHLPSKLIGHTARTNRLVFSPNDAMLVTASNDCTARIWDASTGENRHILEHSDSGVWCVDYAADGQHLVTAGEQGGVRVWNPITGELIHLLSGHSGLVQHACFSADSQRIASAAEPGSVRIWDTNSGMLVGELDGHLTRINVVEFSATGHRLVTATEDGHVYLWDGVSYKRLIEMDGHQSSIVRAIFSADSKSIATISWDKTIRLWDGLSGSSVAILGGHEDSVRDVDISSDGSLVASASGDSTVRIWRVSDGDAVSILEHGGEVNHVSFSSDARMLLSACSDGTARLWHVASGTEVCVLDHDGSAVVAAQLSHTCQKVASAAADGTIRIWTLPTDLTADWLQTAIRIKPRALSDDERNRYLRQEPAVCQFDTDR